MIPDIREVDDPKVGRFYMVPSVVPNRRKLWTSPKLFPIYGPLHEDREFIKFEFDHWHIDWRFVEARYFRHRLRFYGGVESRVHGMPINQCNTDGAPPIPRRFKMLREMPPYVDPSKIFWINDLENAFADRVLSKCRTCPHRGVPLRNIRPNERGEVTCPAHGLTWDTATGKLVRRAQGQIAFSFDHKTVAPTI